MTIYVDGDACPVLKNITKIAKEKKIEMMLYTRYQVKKSINSKQKNHIRGPKKRTEIDNRNFETGLNKLLSKHLI